jgi:hypothetical protein
MVPRNHRHRQSNKARGDDMLSMPSNHFLRIVLWADAATCLICGLLQVSFVRPLSQYLSLTPALLAGTGDFLLLYGAAVAFLATRARAPAAIIWLLVVGNIAWGAAGIGILLAGDVQPTLLGKGYIAAQALTVLLLARLQYICVRSVSDARGGLRGGLG